MNNNDRNLSETCSVSHPAAIRDKIRKAVATQSLNDSRTLIKKIAAELKISYLDCAAALAFADIQSGTTMFTLQHPKPQSGQPSKYKIQPGIRLIRYRLDIGRNHKINMEYLKKVLVEESGVDVNNIVNLRIHDNFSLVDLPDEMPQEIFHHLKEVEINSQKLAIKRLKFRNKRRSQARFQRLAPYGENVRRPSHETDNQ